MLFDHCRIQKRWSRMKLKIQIDKWDFKDIFYKLILWYIRLCNFFNSAVICCRISGDANFFFLAVHIYVPVFSQSACKQKRMCGCENNLCSAAVLLQDLFKLNWAKRGNRVQNHHLSVFQKRRKFDSHIAMIQGGQYNKNHFCSVNNLFQISAGKRYFTKSGCIRVSFN